MESLYTDAHTHTQTHTRQLYLHARLIRIMCECKHESILSSQETSHHDKQFLSAHKHTRV